MFIEKIEKITAADSQWHTSAQADEAVGDAYRKLLTFKNMFDQMEEIPHSYEKLYKQIGVALDLLGNARKETTQLKEMTRRTFEALR